jgi:hypothetical protein
VFIYGTDITQDVTDVSVHWNYGRSPNMCSISLLNLNDKYIYTTENLKTIFKGEQTISDALDKMSGYVAAVAEASDQNDLPPIVSDRVVETSIENQILINVQNIQPDIKRQIIESKITERVKGVQAQEVDGQLSNLNPLKGDAFRYPFQAEDSIFHPNDEIRIFFRDPFAPTRWYHMFAGFVSNFDDNVDENNQRILTISGEGPLKAFRYARTVFNPGILDINTTVDKEKDMAIRTFWQSGLANLTLPELIFFMVFGNNPDSTDGTKFSLKKNSPVGESVTKENISGVGKFNYKQSGVFEFGPSASGGTEDALKSININKIDSLSAWQSLIDHEVKVTDLDEMATPDVDISNLKNRVTYLPDGVTPNPTSIIDIIGTNSHVYPVDGGRVLMLIPASFHPATNREVLLRDILSNPSMVTEYSSRLRVILDTIERIEFVFYESPKGDLICEFPLYDFHPKDWGLDKQSHYRVEENGQAKPYVDETRGPFGSRYMIDKRDTVNFSKQITDEKVRTQVMAYWNTFQGMPSEGTSAEYQSGVPTTLYHLIPLYGYRTEQVNPKGFISTKAAAQAYGHLVLNKMNADARNIGINALPNFGTWLNRPVYFTQRNCIGTTVSLDHSIKWGMGGSVDTRINLNNIRGWDGLVNNAGEPEYTAIGGHPSRPLNYKVLFRLVDTNSGNNTKSPEKS